MSTTADTKRQHRCGYASGDYEEIVGRVCDDPLVYIRNARVHGFIEIADGACVYVWRDRILALLTLALCGDYEMKI